MVIECCDGMNLELFTFLVLPIESMVSHKLTEDLSGVIVH